MKVSQRSDKIEQRKKLWKKLKFIFKKLTAGGTGAIIGCCSTITLVQYFELDIISEIFCWLIVFSVFSTASIKTFRW